MAIINSGTDLQTYNDLVSYVIDCAGLLERSGLNERHARSAVRFAYRDLPNRHEWNYYYRQRILQTVASYDTGTVQYDHTGGTYERMLTLTTGTWPTWAAFGRVIIDSVHYEVEYRKSSSVITLSETSNPGDDVASGTTYTLYRNSYPLPANFDKLIELWDVGGPLPIFTVDQRSQHEMLQVFYSTPGTPVHATIRATGKYANGFEIVFGPPPDDIFTYDLLFQSYPRALSIDDYSTGTVSITPGTASVTGANTTFPVNCAGSVIRFGSGPTKPSGYLGSIDGADNPFVYQAIIQSRDSATGLTLEESMPSTVGNLSGVGYTISDPLDIEPQRMLTVLQRMAEAEFARLRGEQTMTAKAALAAKSLREAMEADESFGGSRQSRVYDPIRRATVSTE
jgi:hypothetical protein